MAQIEQRIVQEFAVQYEALMENHWYPIVRYDNAEVVLLDSQDPDYSLEAIKISGRTQENDDVINRPVIYIEVKEMAPIRSCLRKVKILEPPPD
ncbi:MAG: hypothetical protein ACE5I1_12595, partial [bacterium]